MTRRSSKAASLLALLNAVQLLLFIPMNSIHNAAAATHPQDVDALVALHTAWLRNPSSWDMRTDPCKDKWLGIQCNADQTRVVQLFLINQGLAGMLSPAIGNLTQLEHLDVSYNEDMGGRLPAEIGRLAKLQRFFAQTCNLTGIIPSEIGNMTSLRYFGLTENQFNGTLPSSIGFLKKIIWLDVSENELSGSLPDSSTSGIGSGLDNLTNAIHFHLQDNAFSGSLPVSIFNTKMQLQHLLLDDNYLVGNVPSIISNLLHAEIVQLSNNLLNGTIPSTISRITNLITLKLDTNQFSGQMPDLSNNMKLQMLTIGNNPFQASTIPSWITNMKKLCLLSMDSANLIGNIPTEIFGFSQRLSNISLVSNHLNGTLNLTLANPALLVVNLTDNLIANVDEGHYTQELILDGNLLCASAPSRCTFVPPSEAPTPLPPTPSPSTTTEAIGCIGDCSSDYEINPKLAGSCQCVLPVVTECEFYAVKIPFLTANNTQDMEVQFVNGFSNSEFLEGITLQANQITVRAAASDEVRVMIFPPPDKEQWSTYDANIISYALQNQEIQFPAIGPITCEFEGSPYPTVIHVPKKLSKGAKIGISIGVFVSIVFVAIIGLHAMKQKKRAERAEEKQKPFAAWIATGEDKAMDIPQLKGAQWFSLQEIRRCTNNFSDTNYIGKGGYGNVYVGVLASGEQVAIKRAGDESHQSIAEFKNEIELLSRVHHKNLVALVGFCYEDGEQILVFEYMPNGTLRDILRGEAGLQMDWNRRVEIALDAAKGIAYLHTDAHPPIIHSDIMSSNILLDKKLVAKVSDFGLSKLAIYKDGLVPISVQVRGTLGYLDPDFYLTSQLTEKSDVYSFGVVLLEIITGKQPIDGSKYIVREATMAYKKNDMDFIKQSLVDPKLIEYPPQDFDRLLRIALKCVDNDPSCRPSMVEVVKELETLAPKAPAKLLPDKEVDKLNTTFYRKPLPYLQQDHSTSSYENSESYTEIIRPVEPK